MTGASGRVVLTVAAVYGYFLLFAQFAFIELMRGSGVSIPMEQAALGGMALAGILAGFVTAFRSRRVGADAWLRNVLRSALAGAVVTALMARWCAGPVGCVALAVLTGASLGSATVALASLLPRYAGVAWAGVGTGLGYAACNLPVVFMAAPATQAGLAAALAGVGLLTVPLSDGRMEARPYPGRIPAWAMIVVFTALVWLDSAAFFIIQHTADLKAGTWGEGHLWRNAALHLGFGMLSGCLLACGRKVLVISTAFVLLAVAALGVNGEETREFAGWLYPAAVSLYSTALIAWPGWFSGARDGPAVAFRAAWLFAVAGWFGSANGIGMAGALQEVPAWFVAVAGVVVISVLWVRHAGWRSIAAIFAISGVAWMVAPAGGGKHHAGADDRGHAVYVAEGCIHCHSQYPRPGSGERTAWGDPAPLEHVTSQRPVLIGNRRQGPDLANIGARRSEAWLREHFIDPRRFSPDSVMPSYAHLFHDRRGDDLVAWLRRNGIETLPARIATTSSWRPGDSAIRGDGAALYQNHCAVCHGGEGAGDGVLAGRFTRPPANLRQGPFLWTADGPDLPLKVMRVIKFGIPGTDMPGHEVLEDGALRALAGHVASLRAAGVSAPD